MDQLNGTGCHFQSCTNGSDVSSTTDTHGLENIGGNPGPSGK